jgi:hypothetical protein
MTAYGGVDAYLHFFLTSQEMEVSDKFHAQFALLTVKEPRYPLNTRLSGPKAGFGDNRNLLSLPGIEN